MAHKVREEDPKVRATAVIWGCAVGLFGICVPLVAITKSGVMLPLLVLLGAGGGTAAVWFSPDRRQQSEPALSMTVKALEERIENLEAIYVRLPEGSNPLSALKADRQ